MDARYDDNGSAAARVCFDELDDPR